jgi:hypothetical protein
MRCNNEYLDKWTGNMEKAKDFKKVSKALKFVQTSGLEEMVVAFAFDNPAVIAVPVAKLHPVLSSASCALILAVLSYTAR